MFIYNPIYGNLVLKLKNLLNSKIHWYVLLSVLIISLSGFSQSIDADTPMKSNFLTSNTDTDKTDATASWNLTPSDSLTVNLLNSDLLTVEQYNAVVYVITSVDSIELNDDFFNKENSDSKSKYYLGWTGALNEAQKNKSVNTIPSNYNILRSSVGDGDITIQFSEQKDPLGYSGYTQSILQNDVIVQSRITIYDVDHMRISDLTTIVRHEFGHALGLDHSSTPDDLMAPIILTALPYISECDVYDVQVLYGGDEYANNACTT
jgi:hypothetical protein